VLSKDQVIFKGNKGSGGQQKLRSFKVKTPQHRSSYGAFHQANYFPANLRHDEIEHPKVIRATCKIEVPEYSHLQRN